MLELAAVSGTASLILLRSAIGTGVSVPWFRFAVTAGTLAVILAIPLILLLAGVSDARPLTLDWYGALSSVAALLAGGAAARRCDDRPWSSRGPIHPGSRQRSLRQDHP